VDLLPREQGAKVAVKPCGICVGEEAWGHDLVVPERRAVAVAAGTWPDATADEAGRLARHYIPTRYPDAHASGHAGDHYRRADADTAAADARRILAAVDAAWATGQTSGRCQGSRRTSAAANRATAST
jgi:HEPN domain-containing protein